MRVAILGSRRWSKPGEIFHRCTELMEQHHGSLFVVHGDDQQGVDVATRWACEKLEIDHLAVPFEWDIQGAADQTHSKNCGLMDQVVDLVIVYHEDPENHWIQRCLEEARERGITVEEHLGKTAVLV